MTKYADEFQFSDDRSFGELNKALKRSINLLNMTSDAIEALSEEELTAAYFARHVDVSQLTTKEMLVSKALSL